MTKLLTKAFEEASRLPKEEQDELAELILEELESERRWTALFAGSTETLRELADQARREHTAGASRSLSITDE